MTITTEVDWESYDRSFPLVTEPPDILAKCLLLGVQIRCYSYRIRHLTHDYDGTYFVLKPATHAPLERLMHKNRVVEFKTVEDAFAAIFSNKYYWSDCLT